MNANHEIKRNWLYGLNVDREMFLPEASGLLVPIRGEDQRHGAWEHVAFVPHPLPAQMPALGPETYLSVADARAALGALDSTAKRLPNPQLLRQPSLRREAQSTSALEGTFAPLDEVLDADADEPATGNLHEILNYVVVAETAFDWLAQGRGLTAAGLAQLQGRLVEGTASDGGAAGRVRDVQVVIGRHPSAPVTEARFVPMPPGLDLDASLRDLLSWIDRGRDRAIDPVVAAAMAHYQFETLHPFNDGNGRLGRLLIVLHLVQTGVLSEPTLTVSPWFEARREEYFDSLLGVSARGDWDAWVLFFAKGIEASATETHAQMVDLVEIQKDLHERVRKAGIRADSAHTLVDFAVGQVTFSVKQAEKALQLSYARVNTLIEQLVQLGILSARTRSGYRRRFHSPQVNEVVTGRR